MRNLSIIVATALFLTGCSLAPKLEPKNLELPAQLAQESVANAPVNMEWWRAFGDSSLEALILEALEHNSDLRQASARVSSARATLSGARADQYPSLALEASGARQEGSNERYPGGTRALYNHFSLSAVLQYELDLWGRWSNAKNATKALFKASEAERDMVRLAVASGVAESYFNLLALKESKRLSEETLQAYEKSHEEYLKQFRAGVLSEIVLEQSKVELASAKANLHLYERQESEAATALAILLGRTPKEIFEGRFLVAGAFPAIPSVPVGMPSELLQQRPDIRAALERLKAANHTIGVARAGYFPRLSLSALAGYQSAELDRLVRASGEAWSAGANLASPILDFGRVGAKVDSAKAQKESAEVAYEETIRRAFGEVRDALIKKESTLKITQASKERLEAQTRVLEIAQKRFDSGYSSHLELLEAKRGYLGAQLALVRSQLDEVASTITLYKALGGGWRE